MKEEMSRVFRKWDQDPTQFLTASVGMLAGLMCSLYYAHTIPFLWGPICLIVSVSGAFEGSQGK